MPKPHALLSAARNVAERIPPLETALDESFSQAAGLLAYLPQARVSAGLPMKTGQEAMAHLVISLQSIAQAREAMIAAHAALAQTGTELRIPETGFGSLGGCPSAAVLHVVHEQAA